MTKYITIEASRTAYAPNQISRTMTVGELIEILEQYDEDTPVIISNDNGYTYGGLREFDFREIEDEDEE